MLPRKYAFERGSNTNRVLFYVLLREVCLNISLFWMQVESDIWRRWSLLGLDPDVRDRQ